MWKNIFIFAQIFLMETISLSTRNGNVSKIYVDSTLLSLPGVLRKHAENRRIVAIIDQNVDSLYGDVFPFEKITVRASEHDKSLATAERVLAQLIELHADRDVFLLGIGGGITTDLCGFVASIFKRGVEFGFVPTTLLAMIDAAIGGKNGVNLLTYKNMVGSIRQPSFVFVPCTVLQSLPISEFRNALPEMWKTFLIAQQDFRASADFFAHLEHKTMMQHSQEVDLLLYYIKEAINIKCRIVERDECERGERRLLNLGHTFAHALEHCDPNIAHGEAVGIGLVLAAHNSALPQLEQQIAQALDAFGLRCALPCHINKTELLAAMHHDKKITAGKLNFVGFDADGKVCVKSMEIDALRL